MHTALWVLAATSVIGALVSLLRPPHAAASGRAERRASEPASMTPARGCGSARSPSCTGTTPRTIRYYEEIGLLPASGGPRARRAPALRRGGRRARCASCCGSSSCSASRSRSCASWSPPTTRARCCAASCTAPTRRPSASGSCDRLDALAERQLAAVDRRAAELDALREEIRARRKRIADLLAGRDVPG